MVLISIEATCFLNTCTYVTVKLRNASLLRRLAKSSLIWTKALPQVRALSMKSFNWWCHRLNRDKGQGHSNLQMVCDTPSSQYQLTATITLKKFNVPLCKLVFSCYGYIDLDLWPSDLNVNRFICCSIMTNQHTKVCGSRGQALSGNVSEIVLVKVHTVLDLWPQNR